MKVYELLSFNREMLKRIHHAGIKPDDYKYLDLFNEYGERVAQGEKVTYVVACLSEKYHISERQVYNIIGKFSSDVSYCKICAVR